MKKRRLILLSLVLLIVLMPVTAFGAGVSGALWRGTVRITNSGSTVTDVIATANINSQALIDNGYAADNLSDVAVQYGGNDVAFMPSVNSSYPWAFAVDSISAGLNIDYSLYSGNATGGLIRYFPDDAGMSANYSATLELADNFTIEQSGWVDTSYSANKTLILKPDAFKTYISAAGNITSTMPLDVGAPVIDRASSGGDGKTFIDLNNPSALTGRVTSIDVWASANISGLVVGSFYNTAGQDYTCRDSHSIGTVTSGSKQTFSVDFTIADGDYIGFYCASGNIEKDTTGFDGIYWLAGEHSDPGDSGTYSLDTGDAFSLYGTGGVFVTAPDISSGNMTVKTQYQPNLLTNSSFETGDPPDDWALAGAGATWEQSTAQVKIETYSVNLTRAVSNCYVSQSRADYVNFIDKTVSFGCWVWASVPSACKVQISDGVSGGSSPYHSGSSTWEWLTGNRTIAGGATRLRLQLHVESANNTIAYFDGVYMMVDPTPPSDYNTLRLFVDEGAGFVEKDQVYTEVAVPSNSENWTYYENMGGWWEYTKIWCGDTLQQHIEWEYNPDIFTDLSGKGHHVTPTFRTAPSDNISASLISFNPVNESEVSTFTLSTSYDILIADATPEGNMFDDGDYSKLPAEPINALLDAGGIPRAAWWLPFIFLGICVIGFITYGATTMTRNQSGGLSEGQIDGSLLIMFIVMEALLVVFGTMGVIPLWPSYLFPLAGLSLILSRKHFAWG